MFKILIFFFHNKKEITAVYDFQELQPEEDVLKKIWTHIQKVNAEIGMQGFHIKIIFIFFPYKAFK